MSRFAPSCLGGPFLASLGNVRCETRVEKELQDLHSRGYLFYTLESFYIFAFLEANMPKNHSVNNGNANSDAGVTLHLIRQIICPYLPSNSWNGHDCATTVATWFFLRLIWLSTKFQFVYLADPISMTQARCVSDQKMHLKWSHLNNGRTSKCFIHLSINENRV